MLTGITSMQGDEPRGLRYALMGAGVLAANVHTLLAHAGAELCWVVDEIKTGTYLGVPIIKAAQLGRDDMAQIDCWLVAISIPRYREAAITRAIGQGIPANRILAIEDDAELPMLGLLLTRYRDATFVALRGGAAGSFHDLQRGLLETEWNQLLATREPDRPTVAFCFYGRGGGFRRHLRGLIPRLRTQYNLIALTDEYVPAEPAYRLPELFMSPGAACHFENMDLAITAHFIPCCPNHIAKLNVLHTSFDFILDAQWLVDRFDNGCPHYLFASTRATFDWLTGLIAQAEHQNALCVIPGGYMRLDDNLRAVEGYTGTKTDLIYAPTLSLNAVQYHEYTYSMPMAAELLESLLAAFPDRRIIFRPHPNDLQLIRDGRRDALAAPLNDALAVCERETHCQLDDASLHYMHSYNASAVMISDTSSTAYTYALSTLCPVVFLSPHEEAVQSVLGDQSAYLRDRACIGYVADSVAQVIDKVRQALDQKEAWSARISEYRNSMCFNIGHAEDYLVTHIDRMLGGQSHPDWRWFDGQ